MATENPHYRDRVSDRYLDPDAEDNWDPTLNLDNVPHSKSACFPSGWASPNGGVWPGLPDGSEKPGGVPPFPPGDLTTAASIQSMSGPFRGIADDAYIGWTTWSLPQPYQVGTANVIVFAWATGGTGTHGYSTLSLFADTPFVWHGFDFVQPQGPEKSHNVRAVVPVESFPGPFWDPMAPWDNLEIEGHNAVLTVVGDPPVPGVPAESQSESDWDGTTIPGQGYLDDEITQYVSFP